MINPVFYNQTRSGYDELISYGPSFYKDILEMDANYQFAGRTLDIMADGLEQIVSNQFIDFAGEEAVRRYESWLGISSDTTRSLSDRRKKVKLVWNGGEKLNGSLIKRLVNSYIGCEPELIMTTHLVINIDVAPNDDAYITDLKQQLDRMMPAHLAYSIFYNKILTSTMYLPTVWQDDEIFSIRQVEL
nr:MAG TPA: tail protein [Caudoviricetes sp.]